MSESNCADVKKYIEDQERHHLTMSYQFRRLCQKHGIEIDERYVWD